TMTWTRMTSDPSGRRRRRHQKWPLRKLATFDPVLACQHRAITHTRDLRPRSGGAHDLDTGPTATNRIGVRPIRRAWLKIASAESEVGCDRDHAHHETHN